MRPTHRVFLISMLLGCGAKQAAPPPAIAPPAEAVPSHTVEPFDVGDLRFAWPAPGRVVVVEEVVKKGTKARMRYTLVIEPAGGGLHVNYEDFQFLALDGIDLDAPENAAQVAQLNGLSGAIPTLVISEEGELAGFEGFDRTMEVAIELVLPTVDPAQRDEVRAMMSSDAMRASVEAKGRDPWRAWVEAWTIEGLPKSGESVDFEEEDGTPVAYQNRGLQPDGSLRLELLRTKSVSPEEAGAPFGDFVTEGLRDHEIQMKLTSTAWVETTRTLQPRRAYYESTHEVVSPAEANSSSFESHHYTFTW